jgi:hypothetical protein
MYDVQLCKTPPYLYVQILPKKMYTHFNAHLLLKCIHFLADPSYIKLHICISNYILLGSEIVYDKTDLFRIISVYRSADVFWICF